jgi:hypothetical protein
MQNVSFFVCFLMFKPNEVINFFLNLLKVIHISCVPQLIIRLKGVILTLSFFIFFLAGLESYCI